MDAKRNSSFAAKIKNGVRNMRSTFNILFYVNKSKEKNGVVPVMGRVTINGTQSQFSCKKTIPLDMWDVKGNCAKGRSKEALQINRELDNIKGLTANLIISRRRLSSIISTYRIVRLSLRQRWCATPIRVSAANMKLC